MIALKDMKLSTRFLLLAAILAVVVVIESGVIILDNTKVSNHAAWLGKNGIPILNKAHELKLAVVQVQQWLTDISATRARDGLNDGFDEAENNAKVFRGIISELKVLDTENIELYQKMLPVFDAYYLVGKKMAQAYIDEGPEGGNQIMAQFDVVAAKMAGEVDGFLTSVTKKTVTSLEEQQELLLSTRFYVIVGSLIILLSVCLIYFIMSRALAQLPKLVAEMQQVVEGNLTSSFRVESASNDEIGQLMKMMIKMVDKLHDVIGQVRSGADSLASASEEVNATAQSLSQGAIEQATSVEGSCAFVEEVNGSVQRNAENAKVTEGMATKAAQQSKEGGDAVLRTVEAMRKIAGKIGLIEDIAYKTNMLSLNAAIEAARASEHGKGFAVVAAEVRKLAESSAKTAQEINELTSYSVEIAEQAGSLLQKIVPSIDKTAELVQEIAAASTEQGVGIEQINQSMKQVDDATQQNAAAAEELSATSEELSDLAAQLQQVVAFFQLVSDIKGQPVA